MSFFHALLSQVRQLLVDLDNYFLFDEFEQPMGTLINAYTPPKGTTPVVLGGTHAITSVETLLASSAGLILYHVGADDYVFEGVFQNSSNTASMRIDMRYADNIPTTTHRIIFDFNSGNARLREYNGSGTTPTQTITDARTLPTGEHFLRVECIGTSVRAFLDGVLYVTMTTAVTTGQYMAVYGDTIFQYHSYYIFPGALFANGVIDLTSHCWFARQKLVYDDTNNKSYIGQHHNDGTGYTQHVLTFDHATGTMTTVKVGTVSEHDDHNEPSILVRNKGAYNDNRLFICYAEHGKSVNIRYRISTNPLDASAFGSESTYQVAAPGSGNFYVTYPSCFQASNGDIYIFYRETVNGWAYVKSTDGGATFGGRVLFFYGGGARGYLTFYQSPVDPDIIHMLGSNGHPDNTYAVAIYGFYFDCSGDTVHQLDGTNVTGSMPLVNSSMTLLMSTTLPDTAWFEDVVVDENGDSRYLMTKIPNAKNDNYLTKELWYCECVSGVVSTPTKIHTAAAKYMDTKRVPTTGGIAAYPPNSCFSRSNPSIIYASKEVSGVCELFKIVRNSPTEFTSFQLTENSPCDQWRPFASAATERNLFFLHKRFYYDYQNFDSQMLCNITA